VSAAKPDALLLDEMFCAAIARELAARGTDCRAVTADPVLRSLSDLEIFEIAVAERRVLVTNNMADFESLRRAREAAGGAVPGLIYTCDASFPRTRAYVTRLATALEAAARAGQTGHHGSVLWLRATDARLSASAPAVVFTGDRQAAPRTPSAPPRSRVPAGPSRSWPGTRSRRRPPRSSPG